jgi:hypothetical protein
MSGTAAETLRVRAAEADFLFRLFAQTQPHPALQVDPANPARGLCERLVFRAIAEDDLHLEMEWPAEV